MAERIYVLLTMKILIVDDDFVCRSLMEEVANDFGDCISVASGRDALTACQRASSAHDPFDLILLDIMMPEMDGQEVLKRVRKMNISQPKIILTTALTNPVVLSQNMSKRKYDGFISKPISRQDLNKELQRLRLINEME